MKPFLVILRVLQSHSSFSCIFLHSILGYHNWDSVTPHCTSKLICAIPATHAVPVPSLSVIVVLSPAGQVSVFSGTQKVKMNCFFKQCVGTLKTWVFALKIVGMFCCRCVALT